eukprot:11649712-Prorocentrum_lima.AAC.1
MWPGVLSYHDILAGCVLFTQPVCRMKYTSNSVARIGMGWIRIGMGCWNGDGLGVGSGRGWDRL